MLLSRIFNLTSIVIFTIILLTMYSFIEAERIEQKAMKKRPTMKDVAKAAGVSQTTVSLVLNDANAAISDSVKKKVLDTVQELNFVPRAKIKNYSKPSDNVIALFIPNTSNYFYTDLVRSVDTHARSKGYKVLIINTSRDVEDEKHYYNLLLNIKIAGIVYGFTPSLQDVDKAKGLGIPTVIIGEADVDYGIDIVSLDSFTAGEIVGKHLVELNHKRIAYISSPMGSVSLSRKKRLQGLESSLAGKASLKAIADTHEYEMPSSNYEFELGYNLTLNHFKHHDDKLTALVGANDMIAFGIIKALRELKISVPEDVSVCGFDNILFSQITSPALTTVEHCTDQRVRLALDILSDKITEKYTLPLKVNYEPRLIQRETTAPAKS